MNITIETTMKAYGDYGHDTSNKEWTINYVRKVVHLPVNEGRTGCLNL